MFGFNPSNASGTYHLASLFKSNKNDDARLDVWNIGRYKNAAVDELLTTADSAPTDARQTELLGEAQRIIWEDAPYLWLQINENVSAVRKGRSSSPACGRRGGEGRFRDRSVGRSPGALRADLPASCAA